MAERFCNRHLAYHTSKCWVQTLKQVVAEALVVLAVAALLVLAISAIAMVQS